jgi:RHS repeat-associated protein
MKYKNIQPAEQACKEGDIIYTNDKDGNTLSEKGLRYEAKYEYNGQNRMVYSEVTSHVEKTHNVSFYAYDALGRRTLTESVTGQTLRTVYDGGSFEVIREGETFRNGMLTTQYADSVTTRAANTIQSNEATGERYRWIGEGGVSTVTEDGYYVQGNRYGTRGVTLYGKGEAVAVSYSSSATSRSVYLGKDILGSVRSATSDNGTLEDRYEYDAFGEPYKGDLSGGMNLGYTGKPYDTATGLYNYGYRDYKPEAARFTTIDPIRDGNNWFAYVNNDPANYIDLLGLRASDAGSAGRGSAPTSPVSTGSGSSEANPSPGSISPGSDGSSPNTSASSGASTGGSGSGSVSTGSTSPSGMSSTNNAPNIQPQVETN